MAEKTVIIPRPPQPPEKQVPKKSVNKLVFLIIALVIILVGIGLYFMTRVSKETNSQSEIVVVTTPTSTPGSSQDSDFSNQTRDLQGLSDADTLVTMVKLYRVTNPTLKLPKGPFCSPSQLPTATQTASDGTGWLQVNFKLGNST